MKIETGAGAQRPGPQEEKEMTKIVNEIEIGGKTRKIIRDNSGKFWSIAAEDIKNGQITKAYNGLQGMVSDTKEECERRTKQSMRYNYLTTEKGMSMEEAFAEVFRLEKIEGGN